MNGSQDFFFSTDKGTNRQKDGQTMIISMDPWSKKIFCRTNQHYYVH